MNKAKLFLMVIILLAGYTLTAQVAVTSDGSSADPSAMLEVKSNDKGILIPRMTQAQIEAITNPADGLTVYNTDDCKFYVYRDCSSNWVEIAFGTGTITPPAYTCGDAFVDSRDGQSYNTVQIGTQCWMAENLNIGTMITGSSTQTNNGTIEKYCYDNDTSNCDTYGGMYQWDEAMQYVTTEGTQGICPSGWHIPTDAEWMTMEESLGMCSGTGSGCSGATGYRGTDEGSKMAGNEPLWTNGNLDQNANFGSSGFDGLPGGVGHVYGSFYALTYITYFWSSSENGSDAWSRYLDNNSAQVDRNYYYKGYGYSLRCVRD